MLEDTPVRLAKIVAFFFFWYRLKVCFRNPTGVVLFNYFTYDLLALFIDIYFNIYFIIYLFYLLFLYSLLRSICSITKGRTKCTACVEFTTLQAIWPNFFIQEKTFTNTDCNVRVPFMSKFFTTYSFDYFSQFHWCFQSV